MQTIQYKNINKVFLHDETCVLTTLVSQFCMEFKLLGNIQPAS